MKIVEVASRCMRLGGMCVLCVERITRSFARTVILRAQLVLGEYVCGRERALIVLGKRRRCSDVCSASCVTSVGGAGRWELLSNLMYGAWR